MQINKQELEKQIREIVRENEPEIELIRAIAKLWDTTIKNAYGDNIHDARWFMNKIDENNQQASLFFEDRSQENENLRRNWLQQSVNIIDACTKGADFMTILKAVEKGGSFDLNNPKNQTNAIIMAMRNNDIVTTSLGLLLSTDRGSVTLPSFGNEYVETNTLYTAYVTSPENLKLLISRYPNGCIKAKNQDALREWAKKQPKTKVTEANKAFYDDFADHHTSNLDQHARSLYEEESTDINSLSDALTIGGDRQEQESAWELADFGRIINNSNTVVQDKEAQAIIEKFKQYVKNGKNTEQPEPVADETTGLIQEGKAM